MLTGNTRIGNVTYVGKLQLPKICIAHCDAFHGPLRYLAYGGIIESNVKQPPSIQLIGATPEDVQRIVEKCPLPGYLKIEADGGFMKKIAALEQNQPVLSEVAFTTIDASYVTELTKRFPSIPVMGESAEPVTNKQLNLGLQQLGFMNISGQSALLGH